MFLNHWLSLLEWGVGTGLYSEISNDKNGVTQSKNPQVKNLNEWDINSAVAVSIKAATRARGPYDWALPTIKIVYNIANCSKMA